MSVVYPPEWQRTRADAIKRADGRCEDCGVPNYARGTLHVHHLTYERFGQELPSDLRVLCSACHREAHRKPFDDGGDDGFDWASFPPPVDPPRLARDLEGAR